MVVFFKVGFYLNDFSIDCFVYIVLKYVSIILFMDSYKIIVYM